MVVVFAVCWASPVVRLNKWNAIVVKTGKSSGLTIKYTDKARQLRELFDNTAPYVKPAQDSHYHPNIRMHAAILEKERDSYYPQVFAYLSRRHETQIKSLLQSAFILERYHVILIFELSYAKFLGIWCETRRTGRHFAALQCSSKEH